jgi:hypothetical protein
MGDGNIFQNTFYSLSNVLARWSGVSRNVINASSFEYLISSPAWLSLNNPHLYRQAVAENPVLFGCIGIKATAAARGKKYLVVLNENPIPWNSGKRGVKEARNLFVYRPNPLQSIKEFNLERYFLYATFGNNYVALNNPMDSFDSDITTVRTMFNLPSEFTEIKQTGKLYDQISIEGIISEYALTNYNPVKKFKPKNIIHFNDLNISGVGNSIIGSSRLENLKMPITNTQYAFEAMNVILKSRGMQGIIKANNKDATGTQIPLSPGAKKEIDETFRKEYGLQDNQKQFLISYSDIDFIKTIMNSAELGIYEEFSNNAMIISNAFGVPPELYKTYISGATFENQVQAVRRLYQDTIIPEVENEDQYWTERLKMRDYGFELRTDFSHIEALQDAFKEKAAALSLNATTAEKAYNNNLIKRNRYLAFLDIDPEPGPDGELYKYEFDRKIGQQMQPDPNANQNMNQNAQP